MSKKTSIPRAFTIIELLVVVSIIALLIGILLPAIGKARDQAKVTQSQSNLRNLGVAHASYAADWNDRQFTITPDSLGSYGSVASYNVTAGITGGNSANWGPMLGWTSGGALYWYRMSHPGNHGLAHPLDLTDGFGWSRMPNVKQFSSYVSGRFYDPVFYAPKDTSAMDIVQACESDPGEVCTEIISIDSGDAFTWSSYPLSASALYSPEVYGFDNQNVNGFFFPGGFRTPSMSQARYPDLKTHMMEHHWLQNTRSRCNPNFAGPFDGCEPWYFNMSIESVPNALMFDGHVQSIAVQNASMADRRLMSQMQEAQEMPGWGENGLWHRNAHVSGYLGYFMDIGYDVAAETSFHMMTSDGILGRDILGSGG